VRGEQIKLSSVIKRFLGDTLCLCAFVAKTISTLPPCALSVKLIREFVANPAFVLLCAFEPLWLKTIAALPPCVPCVKQFNNKHHFGTVNHKT